MYFVLQSNQDVACVSPWELDPPQQATAMPMWKSNVQLSQPPMTTRHGIARTTQAHESTLFVCLAVDPSENDPLRVAITRALLDIHDVVVSLRKAQK
jgi:hypothetical protein